VILGSGLEPGSRWHLILVGLRLTSKIDAESHAMPYSVLIWLALCGVVLLGFSWPWFKLQYMSNTERFRPHDGWLLLFTLLLVSTGVMLMLLNLSYYQRSTEHADQALQWLATQMKSNFEKELDGALRQMKQLPYTQTFRKPFQEFNGFRWIPEYPIPQETGPYPYFEIVFWGDGAGNQVGKIDIRKVATPAVKLDQFPFYQTLLSEINWEERAGNKTDQACQPPANEGSLGACSYFQPILSPNTNEFAPVLATPNRDQAEKSPKGARGAPLVQVLVFRPMSVIDSILPPGYGFAVVDGNCQVLFHSEAFRDLRENFCEESKDRSELRPWLFRGVNAPLNITYGGRGERAYLTNFPFPGLSAGQATYLIVFEEGDQKLTLDLAVNLVCSILLGLYFIVLLIAAAAHLILRGALHWDYAPRIVWPCREFAAEYLQIFLCNALLCMIYRHFYHRLHEAPLLGLTLGVVLLGTLFVIVRLSALPGALLTFGVAGCGVAILGWLAIGASYGTWPSKISASAQETLQEWAALPWLPLALGVYAILVSDPLKWFQRLIDQNAALWNRCDSFLKERSNFFYALAAVSLIACGSVVPCTGFFKYAYDVVSAISLKHDEALFAERLIARKTRIANYYKLLNAPALAGKRLDEQFDRYDKGAADSGPAFFTTENEPSFAGFTPQTACPSPERKAPIGSALSYWIEREIALVTLAIPSNQLGSEINRLGVDETEKEASWERYWLEPSATYVTLNWKETSRAPCFAVHATFSEWPGLQTPERAALAAFLTLVVFWLISLSKKIFLTNVESAPSLEIVNWKQVSDIKRDCLVIGLPRSGKSKQLRKLKGLDLRDFRDLRDLQAERVTAGRLCALEDIDCYSGAIIIDQFDFNMRDPEWNKKRLRLISKLRNETDANLVLVSTIDPLYFLVEERHEVLSVTEEPRTIDHLLDCWARALDKFAPVKLPSAVGDEFAEEADRFFERGGHSARFARWICNECSYTPMLQKIGVELFRKFDKAHLPTRQEIVGMIADRADAYYRMLWAGLTGGERLVLYQLALDGWANPKNAQAIHQLEQKQLIYRQPMYRILNGSFRSFIRSSEHEKEIAEWQKKEHESTWQVLRFVLIAAVIGVGVWLFYAQAQLFQIGTGYITALATLLTAIAGLAGRWRRQGTLPQPGGEA
jgi:hypothetical protein